MNKQYTVLFFSLFFLLLNTSSYSQIMPCTGNTAGNYPCGSIDLASQVDVTTLKALSSTSPNGNDIWGYVSPAGREYALMGLTSGTSFVDVTDPVNPVVIGFLPGQAPDVTSSWRDIREKNGIAYIGADRNQGHGIQVFDLSQLDPLATGPSSALPVTFTEDGRSIVGTNGFSHNIVTNPDTNSNFVYVVGANICSGGVIFYDLDNPTAPDMGSCYSAEDYTHDMLCINYRGPDAALIGQEICIGFNETKYSIIDITDKSDVDLLSSNTYPGLEYTHQGWITDDHKYLLLNDELNESRNGLTMRTFVFDISDLSNPVDLGFYDHNLTCIDHNMFIRGPYAYQANYESGLRVLDISDINNITEAGFFDILPSRTQVGFNGAWGVYPFLPSGNILVSGIRDIDPGVQTGGLFVLSPQLPHHFLETSSADIQTICPGDPVTFTFAKRDMYGFSDPVNYTVADLSSSATSTIDDTSVPGMVTVEITNTGNLTQNEYFSLVSTPVGTTPTSTISAGIIVMPTPTAAPLLSPANNALLTTQTPSLLWTPNSDTDSYNVDIATDNGFNTIVQSASGLTTNQYDATPLADNTTYFWRIRSINTCGEEVSMVFNFVIKTGIVPVELISFEGQLQEKSIQLLWETASETNNAGFEIQRRQENRDRAFQTIGWVDAQSTNGAKYEFIDQQITEGAAYYYQLKQVDYDEQFEFSKIIQIMVPGDQPGMIIYPNPVNANFNIDLFFPNNIRTDFVDFIITDLTGRVVKQVQLTPTSEFSSHEILAGDLAPGVYVARLGNRGFFKPVKFVQL